MVYRNSDGSMSHLSEPSRRAGTTKRPAIDNPIRTATVRERPLLVSHPSLLAKGAGRTKRDDSLIATVRIGRRRLLESSVPHPCCARMGHPLELIGRSNHFTRS